MLRNFATRGAVRSKLLPYSARTRISPCSFFKYSFSTSSTGPAPPHDPYATASADSTDSQTHFGFQFIPKALKETMVKKVFQNVSNSYDIMNDVMSGGVHRLWKDRMVRMLRASPSSCVLDVAGGTGDIAFRVLKDVERRYGGYQGLNVTVVDINEDMLKVGKSRAEKMGLAGSPNLSFQVGNAEALTDIPSSSIDAYTIAFGIRNCTNIDAVLAEAYRVLKLGGRFLCLEFGQVSTPAYDAYSFNVIPAMGGLIAGDAASYKYLVESIRRFPPQAEFAAMIQEAGFVIVDKGYEDLTFGVAAIHSGVKLED